MAEETHELNETLEGGEMIDREETPQPRSERSAPAERSARAAPAEKPEPEEVDEPTGLSEVDTRVEGLEDDEPAEKAPKGKADAKAEPEADDGEKLDRLSATLDELDAAPRGKKAEASGGKEDDGKGPTVRQAADDIDAERFGKVVDQYGKDDPLVEHIRAMEARHQAQIQQIQSGAYQSAREMHKLRLFSEPLEKAAPQLFGDRDSRAKNPKQARAYEAAAEATTAVAESIIGDAARRNPLVAKILQPHHIANMLAEAMSELAGVPNAAASAGAAERKKIAATLAARQSNAGVGSRPSGANIDKTPQNREEAKAAALAKFRDRRARRAR